MTATRRLADSGRRRSSNIFEQVIGPNLALFPMDREKKDQASKIDLDAEAACALEAARNMKPGAERTEAMKRAGILRNAADLQGLFFAKRGRPAKP